MKIPMYDIVIIGAGPAGITAGIYASRKKLKTLLITKDFVGQIGKAFSIENYPGFETIKGLDLSQKFKNHLLKFDLDIEEGKKVSQIKKDDGLFVIKTDGEKSYLSKTVIIATGRDPRPLEIPGEKKFLAHGISYCVTCDGPLFQDKIVAVIGGGNSGLEAGLELARYCQKVYILHNTSVLIADESTQEKARKNKKIEIILNAHTKEIKGQNFVESLIYQDIETKEEKNLFVQGVFVQIGYIPATGFLKGLVDFNDKDEIMIDPLTCGTKTKGLFAAGDVSDILTKQIITAAAEGAKAALSAYQYIQNISNE